MNGNVLFHRNHVGTRIASMHSQGPAGRLYEVQKSYNHYKMIRTIEKLLYMPPEYRYYSSYYFGRTEYSEMYNTFSVIANK